MADRPCTWCLPMLTSPASALRIMPRDYDADRASEITLIQQEAYSGTLARKAEIITQAFREEWEIELNGQQITAPITTWHGDPVCEGHLYHIAERERQPQTVRMAQWSPARPR